MWLMNTIQKTLNSRFAFICLIDILGTNILRCVISQTTNPIPLWSWECVNEKCVPQKAVDITKLQSLETCNVLCSSLHIWPQPTGWVGLASTMVPVRADLFQLQLVSSPSTAVDHHIQEAFEIFCNDLRILEKSQARGLGEWRNVGIRVNVNYSGDPRMRVDTDESYILSVRPIKNSMMIADITAPTFCGARHALETLLQLIWFDNYEGTLLMIEAATVEDAPRFRYRGILIDTAHTYFPIEELMQNIDAMAASKLNTFHWHMSNSQAFPLHTSIWSQLINDDHDAYSLEEIYTANQVKQLVNRARLRGIRVLIEIDTPAHVSHSLNFGSLLELGETIYCLNDEQWNIYCSEPPCGQLNPHNPRVYEILTQLYKEIMLITGVDDMIHLGGNKISPECWKRYFPHKDPSNLWLEYISILLERFESESTRGELPNVTLFWSSSFSEQFKYSLKKYIQNVGLQIRSAVWSQNHEDFSDLRTIISHEDAWDFNTGHGAWYEKNNDAPYNSWQHVYEHRPWLKHHVGIVEGGEATVWSSILGEGNLIPRIWPRAAALAERLWTDEAHGATRAVHARLDVHRSRLVARGFKVSPLWSMWCTQNTYTCL